MGAFRLLLVIFALLGWARVGTADEILFPPKLAGCGPSLADGSVAWNEKIFSLQKATNQPYLLNSVRIIAAGSQSVRVQVGPRNSMPVLDVVLEDFVISPPIDVTRNMGSIPFPSGSELVVRIGCVGGQFPNDTALLTVILEVQ
jgi:hypothetical protein